MESLPPETIQYVAGLLAHHPSSLRAFACVNWGCHYAASTYLFHTLRFEVRESQDVISLTEQYSRRLERASAFSHVRCVIIKDDLDEEKPKQTARSRRYKRRTDPNAERNTIWLPLAYLAKRLSGLSDLTFGGSHRFPVCILDILHEYYPHCRLHMHEFRPQNIDGTPIADGRLGSSPCLCSIKYSWSHQVHSSRSNTAAENELTMSIIAGSAPNLKEVTCNYGGLVSGSEHTSSPAGRFQPNPETDSRACLTFLSLLNYFSISDVADWMSCTDFSVLQTLKLHQDCKQSALRYLMENAELPCLNTMSLGLTHKYRRPPYIECETMSDFLLWLPPLKSLTLFGWSPSGCPLGGFLLHHGNRLVDLSLSPCRGLQPNLSHLKQIAEYCPLLEKLAISIQRTYGNAREVASYRALGSLPKLQHLTLDLDVSDLQQLPDEPLPEDSDDEISEWQIPFDPQALPNHASLREFDLKLCVMAHCEPQSATNGRLRGALINTAIDKTLACSVFETVSAAKPEGSISLKKIDIKCIRIGEFGGNIKMSNGVLRVFKTLAKEWRVEQNPRDDTDEAVATETGDIMSFRTPSGYLGSEFTKVWRSLWPEHESGDWKNEWHSFPLSI